MNIRLRLNFIAIAFFGLTGASWSQVTTFEYTGGEQTFIVPPGVSTIQIEAWGAEGGGSEACGGLTEEDGGLGGYAVGNLSVIPGSELKIYVGGKPEIGIGEGIAGGYNGGGASGQWAGAGGGASDVRIGGTGLEHRVIVAGGGGGGNTGCPDHGTGGVGGGLIGGEGIGLSGYDAGMGGTQIAGGLGAGDGSSGMIGVGGTGGYHVAGGGGGLYGGGAAYAAGGGGGSSYIDGLLEASTTPGVREGHGRVTITVLCIALLLEDVDTEICLGEEIVLDGSSETGGTVMWSDGVENGVPFIPGGVGTYTYTATSTSGTDCSMTVEVEVHDVPDIVANADPEVVCLGQELTLSGSGGAFYEWGPGDIDDDVPFVPELGTHTYTVTGEDWYGCFNTDEITVTVVESPEVTASASDDNICLGESVTLSGGGAVIYEWDMGVEDGVAFTPDEIGTFEFNVEGYAVEDGCFGEASIEITVNEVPTIESFTTTVEVMGDDGEIDITVTGGTPAYTFDWDNDGTGDFDDPEDLTGIPGGTYTVIVSDENECEATITATVDSQVGIESLENQTIAVYPNPTSDNIILFLEGNYSYKLFNLQGAIIASGNAVGQKELSLQNLADGTYLVEITQAETIFTAKIVKE